MQITTNTIGGKKVVFESILDEVPGGASLPVTRLDYLTSGKEYLKAGAPVYVDLTARTAQVCKSVASVASTATILYVLKGHHFKANDYISDAVTGVKITSIAASGTLYDNITVPSGLDGTAGKKFFEPASGSAAGVILPLYYPNGLTRDDIYIKDGNADVAVVKIGTAREDALEYPLPDLYKIALRGDTAGTGTSLITIV